MTKWHYINSAFLAVFDPELTTKNYQHSVWFRALEMDFFPVHVQSRVHAINTPWDLCETLIPMPLQASDMSFAQAIETVAQRYVHDCEIHGREPYICWSGGIDSTSILVSLLKTAPQNFLSQLTVLLDQNSCKENPYFYHRFIQGQLKQQDINEFDINSHNYQQISVVDGETGNQCMGSTPIHFLAQAHRYSELDSAWRTADQRRYFDHPDSDVVDMVLEMIDQSLDRAPCELHTVHDVLWWWNFNFKFDDAAKRKLLAYTEKLNPEQTEYFVSHGLVRFYSDPVLQQWSLGSLESRRQYLDVSSRYFQKQYIFEFDSNALWYHNKQEEMSQSDYYKRVLWHGPTFAIDQHWNKHRIDSAEQRRQLGNMLHPG